SHLEWTGPFSLTRVPANRVALGTLRGRSHARSCDGFILFDRRRQSLPAVVVHRPDGGFVSLVCDTLRDAGGCFLLFYSFCLCWSWSCPSRRTPQPFTSATAYW